MNNVKESLTSSESAPSVAMLLISRVMSLKSGTSPMPSENLRSLLHSRSLRFLMWCNDAAAYMHEYACILALSFFSLVAKSNDFVSSAWNCNFAYVVSRTVSSTLSDRFLKS